jgi:hypothetical protein
MDLTKPNIPAMIPAGVPPAPAPRPEARTGLHALLHGTPGTMRLLGAVAVLAALLVGAVCANSLLGSRAAADRAANNIAQVVRVQTIHVDLLRADALATNAFLIGGLEPAEHRAMFDNSMTAVVQGLTRAAAAQPADGKALAALSSQVQTYATLVEQARSNNRLGLPVGAQYLTQASAGLRSDAIPTINAIVNANEARSQAEFDRADSSGWLLLGLAAVIGLIVIAVWLARRTHRYLNGPFTLAIALVVLGLFVALSTISSVGIAVSDVRSAQYEDTVRLAQVSAAANDARANESLTLIKRGSAGEPFETAWQADDKTVTDNLTGHDPALLTQWQQYTAGHEEIRRLDEKGNWDSAVKLATSTEDGSPGLVFTDFDRKVTSARDTASAEAVKQIDGAGSNVTIFAIVIGLVSLVACWLVIRGMSKRIEEYR